MKTKYIPIMGFCLGLLGGALFIFKYEREHPHGGLGESDGEYPYNNKINKRRVIMNKQTTIVKNEAEKTKNIECENVSEKKITRPKSILSEVEKKELIARIKAMSQEELEIVADSLPIQFCHNRIGKELKKNAEFAKAIEDSMRMLE